MREGHKRVAIEPNFEEEMALPLLPSILLRVCPDGHALCNNSHAKVRSCQFLRIRRCVHCASVLAAPNFFRSLEDSRCIPVSRGGRGGGKQAFLRRDLRLLDVRSCIKRSLSRFLQRKARSTWQSLLWPVRCLCCIPHSVFMLLQAFLAQLLRATGVL